jgi:ribonuclease HI
MYPVRRVLMSSDGYVGEDGAGWAFVVRIDDAREEHGGALEATTSHLAEWTAVSRALAWAEGALEEGDALELRIDSALVAKGLASRRPEMHGEAGALRAGCRQALARLGQRGIKAQVLRVRREENDDADRAAHRAAQR